MRWEGKGGEGTGEGKREKRTFQGMSVRQVAS